MREPPTRCRWQLHSNGLHVRCVSGGCGELIELHGGQVRIPTRHGVELVAPHTIHGPAHPHEPGEVCLFDRFKPLVEPPPRASRICGDGQPCPLRPLCAGACKSDAFIRATRDAAGTSALEPPPLCPDCGQKATLCTTCRNPIHWPGGIVPPEPPPTPAPPLSTPDWPSDVIIASALVGPFGVSLIHDRGQRGNLAPFLATWDPEPHTARRVELGLVQLDALAKWCRAAERFLVANPPGTTPPVRSVPSVQQGNLALNFCSAYEGYRARSCRTHGMSWCPVAKWHPCSFATLTI